MWPTFFLPQNLARARQFVGEAGERCGTSITFDLDVDFPGVSVGDYVLYFVRWDDMNTSVSTPYGANPERFIQQPSGVQSVWWEPAYTSHKVDHANSNIQGCMWACIYGGFVSDTTANMTFTRNHTTYGLCGYAYRYRGISRRQSVDYINTGHCSYNDAPIPFVSTYPLRGLVFPPVKTHGASKGTTVFAYCEHSTTTEKTTPPGPFFGARAPDSSVYSAHSKLDDPSARFGYWECWAEDVELSVCGANLLAWTPINAGGGTGGFADSSWTKSACSVAAGGAAGHEWQDLVAGGGSSSEHFVYQDVTLTDGETYFLSVGCGHANNEATNIGLSVIDPSSVERGHIFRGTGAPGSIVCNLIGTGADDSYCLSPDVDGIPSKWTAISGIVYIPTQTGTHRIKVLVTKSSGSTEAITTYTTAGESIACMGATLTRGRLGVGAPSTSGAGWRSWLTSGVLGPTRSGHASAMGFSLVLATDTLRPVTMEAGTYRQMPSIGGSPEWSDSAQTVTTGGAWQGHYQHSLLNIVADRWVFPTYRTTEGGADVTGKFYFELAMSGSGSTRLAVLHTSGIAYQGEDSTAGKNGEWWNTGGYNIPDGATAVGTPSTFATTDVIGVSIDHSNSRVTFYKNGTADWYYTWPTAWDAGGGMPMRVAILAPSASGSLANYTARFRASQQTYLPSGFAAYDWAN